MSTHLSGRSRRALPLVACVATALVLAACGSSSKTTSSPASSPATAPASTPSTTATTAANPATGSPVSIMVESAINTPAGTFPGEWGAAQAAADAINKSGGIDGHKLSIVLCNDQFSVNGAVACARQAVSDHVIAYAGFSPFGFAVSPVLKAAGIAYSPWVGNIPDAASPTTFPVNGSGSMTEQLGQSSVAKYLGAKTVAIAETQFPGLAEGIAVTEKELAHLGIKVLGVVKTTETQTDMSAPTQQLLAMHPDAVLLNLAAAQSVTMLQTAQQLGFDPDWISAATIFDVSSLKDAAGLTSKLWFVSAAPAFQSGTSSIPAVNQYTSEMNAAVAAGQSNAAPGNRDGSAFVVWATVHALAEVGDQVHGAITAATFAAALKAAKDVNVVGLWQWTPSATGPIKLLPHVTDGGQAYIGQIKPGGIMDIHTRVPVLVEGGLS